MASVIPAEAQREVDATPTVVLLDHRSSVDKLVGQPEELERLADDLRWLNVLAESFQHEPLLLVAQRKGVYAGHLPLCAMRSAMFGRFLVSLPYLNSAGVRARTPDTAAALVQEAVSLADQRDVRFLELRHEQPLPHPALTHTLSTKVHMRLRLLPSADELMASLKSKRRSQLKNGLGRGFRVRWGGQDVVDDFYTVFRRNMRDLGTPVYGRQLFQSILERFDQRAELCCLYDDRKPVAAALVVHGNQEPTTEVPSASALREYHPSNVNMAMYWHLLERAVLRGQKVFDFGRSTAGGPTFAFKKQWGAEASPAHWQYYVRHGDISVGRPDDARYGLAIRLWKKLPLWAANMLGPRIVRGIP